MKVLAILQARMSSSRFPGKVLAPLVGEPMIVRQIERIRRASLINDLVVATSSDESDDELVRVLDLHGVSVFRGSLKDVLDRFISTIDHLEIKNTDAVVRLTADCPLTDPEIINNAIAIFKNSGVDYCSNTLQPTFPDGLDVEVVNARVLRELDNESEDEVEREHVTLGIYRQFERYRLRNFTNPTDLSAMRWTVDTHQDYQFVTRIYEQLYPSNRSFLMSDVLQLLEQHPQIAAAQSAIERNQALLGVDTGAMQMKEQ